MAWKNWSAGLYYVLEVRRSRTVELDLNSSKFVCTFIRTGHNVYDWFVGLKRGSLWGCRTGLYVWLYGGKLAWTISGGLGVYNWTMLSMPGTPNIDSMVQK